MTWEPTRPKWDRTGSLEVKLHNTETQQLLFSALTRDTNTEHTVKLIWCSQYKNLNYLYGIFKVVFKRPHQKTTCPASRYAAVLATLIKTPANTGGGGEIKFQNQRKCGKKARGLNGKSCSYFPFFKKNHKFYGCIQILEHTERSTGTPWMVNSFPSISLSDLVLALFPLWFSVSTAFLPHPVISLPSLKAPDLDNPIHIHTPNVNSIPQLHSTQQSHAIAKKSEQGNPPAVFQDTECCRHTCDSCVLNMD